MLSLLVLLDVFSLVLAADLAHFLRFQHLTVRPDYQLIIFIAVIFIVFGFANFRVYEDITNHDWGVVATRLLTGYGALGLALVSLLFISKTSAEFSRIWLMTWLAFGFLLSILFRKGSIECLKRQGGLESRRSVTLIGTSEACTRICQALEKNRGSQYVIHEVKWIDEMYFKDSANLSGDITTDEIWFCAPLRYGRDVAEMSKQMSTYSGDIRYVPDLDDLAVLNHGVSDLGGFFSINLSCSPLQGLKQVLKSLEDYVLGLFLVAASSPVMLLVAIGIKMTSSGPVLYRQERVGWNGRCFDMLKFRSMAVGADSRNQRWGGAATKEVTGFGAFLRKTSLDELPQLFNVLRGEMSLVGPRPERSEYVETFKETIPDYMRKHLVKAGITGWAQVNGLRGDTDLDKRIEYDLYYIDNWSLGLDFRIIARTVLGGFLNLRNN
ncbi:exopolysaccharide biosynthesis polyprenyl glycosylphosphotransferase [Halomonas sp. 22501_18_FS]|uniref:exopolysaccharide biosynthesis polyprenyl glycosylphosphotransferase n=1 Tax=Halomonas sp. 22501_18_FS TaxID=2665505 RepID=UPI001368D6D9|nr:exopolysaccharide biosynthesis polyprenyl glycosylphosphotransferase [Halomonas sp. 22501_18_FS]